MPRGVKSRGRGRGSDEGRPSAAARGYGARWRHTSRRHLAANPLCLRCLAAGSTVAAECTDHIKPVTSASDPLFWLASNHQALCWSCHSTKTTTEDAGKGRAAR